MRRHAFRFLPILAALLFALANTALSQTWPARPIKLIVVVNAEVKANTLGELIALVLMRPFALSLSKGRTDVRASTSSARTTVGPIGYSPMYLQDQITLQARPRPQLAGSRCRDEQSPHRAMRRFCSLPLAAHRGARA